jgi:hypothetical protein
MHQLATSLLIVVGVAASPAALQVRSGGGAAAPTAMKACSVLTKDLVLPFAQSSKLLDLVPPTEEAVGKSAAACEYGVVRLQLHAPGYGPVKTQPKDFQALPGVGDLAYFRNNRDQYAELMVWTGTRYFDLQIGVPTGSTADAIKPKAVTLARQVIAKLTAP